MSAGERRARPSQVSHVLFRREDGWTPRDARSWLKQHDFPAPSSFDDVESEGGEKLVAGDYISFRVVPKSQEFTSYGYSDEMSEGVWFKFGGFRPRGRETHASDHLGPSGRYFIEFDYEGDPRTSEPLRTEREAFALADRMAAMGVAVRGVYESDDRGRVVQLGYRGGVEDDRAYPVD